MRGVLFLLCFSAVTYLTSANKAPFITKCKAEDEKCIKDSTQAAIPVLAEGIEALGVEKMDPLFISSVNASTSNLNLFIKDIKVEGMKNCQAVKMRRDVAESKLDVHIMCSVNMVGNYDMLGKLLLFPIEGNGEMRVALNKILIHAVADMEVKVGKDSIKYWNIKKWKHDFELKDKSKVEFDNLFGGNEVLAKSIKKLLNDNSNDVIIDIGQEIIKAVVTKVAKNCNKFFHAVAYEELVISE